MWTNSHVPHLCSPNDQNPKIRACSVRVYALFWMENGMVENPSIIRRHMVGLEKSALRSFWFPCPSDIEIKEAYINLRLIMIQVLEHVASAINVPILPLSPSGLLPKATQLHTAVRTGPITAIPHLKRLSELLT